MITQESLRQKAEELHRALDDRVQHLNTIIQDRDNTIQNLRNQLNEITRDFEYNLSLIKERDTELDSLEQSIEQLNEELRHRDAEITDLRVTIKECDERIQGKGQELHELRIHHQEELSSQRSKFEMQIHQFEQQLRRKDDEIELLRQESERHHKDSQSSFEEQRIALLKTLEQHYKSRESLWIKEEALIRGQLEAARDRLSSKDEEVVRLREELLDVQLKHEVENGALKNQKEETIMKLSFSFAEEKNQLLLKLKDAEQALIMSKRELSIRTEDNNKEVDAWRLRVEELERQHDQDADTKQREIDALHQRLDRQSNSQAENSRCMEEQRNSIAKELQDTKNEVLRMKYENCICAEKIERLQSQVEAHEVSASQSREREETARQNYHELNLQLTQEQVRTKELAMEREKLATALQLSKEECTRLRKTLQVCEEIHNQQMSMKDDHSSEYGHVHLESDYIEGAWIIKHKQFESELETKRQECTSYKLQNQKLLEELTAARQDLEELNQRVSASVHKERDESSLYSLREKLDAEHRARIEAAAENRILKQELDRLRHRVETLQVISLSTKMGTIRNSSEPKEESGTRSEAQKLESNQFVEWLDDATHLEHIVEAKLKLTEAGREIQKWKKKYEKTFSELEKLKSETNSSHSLLQETKKQCEYLTLENKRLLDINNMWRADFIKLVEVKAQTAQNQNCTTAQNVPSSSLASGLESQSAAVRQTPLTQDPPRSFSNDSTHTKTSTEVPIPPPVSVLLGRRGECPARSLHCVNPTQIETAPIPYTAPPDRTGERYSVEEFLRFENERLREHIECLSKSSSPFMDSSAARNHSSAARPSQSLGSRTSRTRPSWYPPSNSTSERKNSKKVPLSVNNMSLPVSAQGQYR